jgi:hypothetical protein
MSLLVTANNAAEVSGTYSNAVTILPSGNVGIGTTSPSERLNINGSGARLLIQDTNQGDAGFVAGRAASEVFLGNNGGLPLSFLVNNTERMRITSAGNVGIGVVPKNWDSLYKVLQISDAALIGTIDGASMTHNLWQDGETQSYITSRPASSYSQNSGNHYWDTAPSGTANNGMTLTNRMILTQSGNVGIGTTSPLQKFDVDGLSYLRNDVYMQTNKGIFFSGNSAYGAGVYGQNSGNDLVVNAGGNEKMRITSGGNVGIGTTSPSDALHVATSNEYQISWSRTIAGKRWALGVDSGATFITNRTDNRIPIFITNGGNVVIANLGTGLVYSNSGTLTSTNPSDERLKDDITDLQYGLNEILQLRPVTYLWKNDTINQGKQFGFIAQEVQEIMPDLVKEFDTKHGDEEVVRLGLDKEAIFVAMVNAIKELKAEIEILKNK